MRGRWGSARTLCIVAVAAGLVATACSGHAGEHASADDGGGPHTARVRITSSSSRGTATFDFTHHIGEALVRPAPSVKGESTTTIFDGGDDYTQLTPGSRSLFPPSLTTGKHWMRSPEPVPLSPLGSIGNGLDPYDALTRLRDAGAHVTKLANTTIDGQSVRHYRASAELTEPVPPAADNPSLRGKKTAPLHATYDLYVDNHTRVVQLDSTTTRNDDPNQRSNRYDFSDYGIKVAVAIPAASDVVDYSTAYSPTPRLQGAWRLVANGNEAGFSWNLFGVAADVDRVCWSFESTPPLKPDIDTAQLVAYLAFQGGSPKPPRHNGHDAVCTRSGVWQAVLQPVAVGKIGSQLVVVGIARDDVTSVTTSRAIPIDARFDGFVDTAATANGTYSSRTRDGKVHTCPVTILELGAIVSYSACDTMNGVLPFR